MGNNVVLGSKNDLMTLFSHTRGKQRPDVYKQNYQAGVEHQTAVFVLSHESSEVSHRNRSPGKCRPRS